MKVKRAFNYVEMLRSSK